MSVNVPIHSSRRTVSFAAADLADADGVITSFASSASPVTKLPANMTGAAMSGTTGRFSKLPRTVTITLASAANQYAISGIVITGERGGTTVTETLTPVTDDGNETLRGVQVFDSIASIAFPAQAGAGGSFQVGVQDIAAPSAQDAFTAVELAANGVVNAWFGVGITDAKPAAANQITPMAARKVLTDPTLAAPTTVGLTVYLP